MGTVEELPTSPSLSGSCRRRNPRWGFGGCCAPQGLGRMPVLFCWRSTWKVTQEGGARRARVSLVADSAKGCSALATRPQRGRGWSQSLARPYFPPAALPSCAPARPRQRRGAVGDGTVGAVEMGRRHGRQSGRTDRLTGGRVGRKARGQAGRVKGGRVSGQRRRHRQGQGEEGGRRKQKEVVRGV